MRRSRAELTFAAVLKAFPALRWALPWATAAVKDKAETCPAVHHEPLPWGAALLLAEALRSRCQPRRAAGILLMWRLGLRPGEFVQLWSDDLWFVADGVSLVKLGRYRGTKTRRVAMCRVPVGDWRTRVLITYFLRVTPAGCRLTDWKRAPDITAALRSACETCSVKPRWTAHSARAGWASAHWLLGTSFSDLKEMGRWSSDAACKVYLDVIAASAAARDDDIARWSKEIAYWDYQFAARWA